MFSTSLIAFAAASAAIVVGYPAGTEPVTSLTARSGDDVVCGTTQDADLSACQSLLDKWPGSLVEDNTCHFGGFWRGTNTAYNVASVPGCSVYVMWPGKESGAVKEAVQKLLGCADKSKGKVNGVTTLADDTYVCVGGNDGCGDCFDDADIDHLVDDRRRDLQARKIDPSGIGAAIQEIVDAVVGDDDIKRANTVRNMVDGMAKRYPKTNVVACHTDHEAKFDGQQGSDWVHEHFEVGISLGRTIGYELYIGESGTFKRNGDGGNINWGWSGVLAKDPEQDGSFLTFAKQN